MSDYSYYIVHEQPPRPEMTLRRRVKSWVRPFEVWTRGSGNSWSGPVTSRRCWRFEKGTVRNVGIDHTGCTTEYDCRCLRDEVDK